MAHAAGTQPRRAVEQLQHVTHRATSASGMKIDDNKAVVLTGVHQIVVTEIHHITDLGDDSLAVLMVRRLVDVPGETVTL